LIGVEIEPHYRRVYPMQVTMSSPFRVQFL